MKIETVGSFLPPETLVKARQEFRQGTIDKTQLTAVEDEAVAALVERQLSAGLPEVTDGEFRRHKWDKDFWFGLDGITRERIDSGSVYQSEELLTDLMRFTSRIAYNPEHPVFDSFTFLHNACAGRARCRQVLPSPANLYLEILGMSDGHPGHIYADADSLAADIAAAYNQTIRRLYELGCRHVQFDDTACAKLIDENFTKRTLQGGIDLLALQATVISLINDSIASLPADMELSLYLSIGYSVVPDWESLQQPDNLMPGILSQVNVGKFYMPFDMGDSRQFEILRYVPEGKKVVLGLADAHSPFVEDIARINEAVALAAKYIPEENLSVSPKTGFKLSTYAERGLTYEDQWQKIAQLQSL